MINFKKLLFLLGISGFLLLFHVNFAQADTTYYHNQTHQVDDQKILARLNKINQRLEGLKGQPKVGVWIVNEKSETQFKGKLIQNYRDMFNYQRDLGVLLGFNLQKRHMEIQRSNRMSGVIPYGFSKVLVNRNRSLLQNSDYTNAILDMLTTTEKQIIAKKAQINERHRLNPRVMVENVTNASSETTAVLDDKIGFLGIIITGLLLVFLGYCCFRASKYYFKQRNNRYVGFLFGTMAAVFFGSTIYIGALASMLGLLAVGGFSPHLNSGSGDSGVNSDTWSDSSSDGGADW